MTRSQLVFAASVAGCGHGTALERARTAMQAVADELCSRAGAR